MQTETDLNLCLILKLLRYEITPKEPKNSINIVVCLKKAHSSLFGKVYLPGEITRQLQLHHFQFRRDTHPIQTGALYEKTKAYVKR